MNNINSIGSIPYVPVNTNAAENIQPQLVQTSEVMLSEDELGSIPVLTPKNNGDTYIPVMSDGGDGVSPTKLSAKIEARNDFNQWQYSDGSIINIMAAIMYFMLDTMFPMFMELQAEQMVLNGQMRFLNMQIVNFTAQMGMDFALKSFEEAISAADWEVASAIAGAVVAAGSTVVGVGGLLKSDTKELDTFDAKTSQVATKNKTLTANENLFTTDPKNQARALKDFVEPDDRVKLHKVATKKQLATEFAAEHQKLIDDTEKKILAEPDPGKKNALVEEYNTKLAKLKVKYAELAKLEDVYDDLFTNDELNITENQKLYDLSQEALNNPSTSLENPLTDTPINTPVMLTAEDVGGAYNLQALKDAGFVDANGNFKSSTVVSDGGQTVKLLYSDDNKNFKILTFSQKIGVSGLSSDVTEISAETIIFNKALDLRQTNLSSTDLKYATNLINNVSTRSLRGGLFDPAIKKDILMARVQSLFPDGVGTKLATEFQDAQGNFSIFSKSENAVMIPSGGWEADNGRGAINVYRLDANGNPEKTTFYMYDETQFNDFKTNYFLETQKGGINDVFYINENGNKLRDILKARAPDGTDIIDPADRGELQKAASRAYTTIEAARIEKEGMDLVKGSFKDCQPSKGLAEPAGKLRSLTDDNRRKLQERNQYYTQISQLLYNFSNSLSMLVRSFADRKNAKAQLYSSEQRILGDLFNALIQASKDTTDAVMSNLRDILSNVVKILELYAAAAAATKVN